MKEILIPLNFTTTPVLYDSKQSFSASDESSGVLTFTTTANVTGTVASLTIRNASENANRQTVLIERLDVNTSPFSYAVKMPLPFGNYEGEITLKKGTQIVASAVFLFGVNSSLSASVLPKLVEAYSLDALVEEVETEVSNLKDAYTVTVSETVKGVNKTESTLQLSENVRYLNEATRKANELLRISQEAARVVAEEGRVSAFENLVDSAVIEQIVTQEVAEKYQEIEATQGNRLLSVESELAETATKAELSAIATPKAVSLVSQMTDVTKIYVYTGVEGGYTAGNWYYHTGTAWASGGVYQSTGVTDGSITEVKLSTAAVTNAKLGDRYNAVRLLTAGENVLSIYREGVYYKETQTSVIGLPTELSVNKSVFLEVSAYNNFNYVQTAVDTTDHNYKYVRVVRLGVDKGWIKYASEAKIDAKLALSHVTDTERMLKNFEKYRADTPTSTLYDMMAAIQDVEVIGVDPSLPLKFWAVCRQYSTWGYRIMMGQKVDGVWVTILDTGTTIPVTESALGSTYYSFTSAGGVTLRMRIDYRAIPVGGRILQGSTMTEEPYYIISPKCVKLTEPPEVVAEVYDQSLNTTDSVQFNVVTATSVIADVLQVGGAIPTGTLAVPPTGLVSGDMWADTTDSAVHPIVRVML